MKIFYLPDLGEGLTEAEIREWYVKVGDIVKIDQPLVSMETAKALVDVPSPYSGKIIELHGEVNHIIKTGAPLISFETDEDEVAHSKHKGTVVGSLEESSHKWDESDVIVGSAKSKTTGFKVLPAARVLAKEMNVDLSLVKPSGPQGLITTDDIKDYLKQQTTNANNCLSGETEALHGVRRFMAQAMMQSHQEIVPVTVIEDVDITNFPSDADITVELLKAIVSAAKAEPSLNAWFDGKSLERKLFHEVHVGLAIDTEEGLFVPVIKDVENVSNNQLRETIEKYKHAVKTRSISAKDMQGATITLSNFGMIAGRYATPIIIPPAVAIIACGRTREAVLAHAGKMVIGRIMPLSLTFDHRAVTGGEATRFLRAIIKHFESADSS